MGEQEVARSQPQVLHCGSEWKIMMEGLKMTRHIHMQATISHQLKVIHLKVEGKKNLWLKIMQ
uniref:Uncharacterized protein n=1 Tax=Rhizophora mucronata TaxID=61149 RepID=A0A2P2JN56_RHIMU